MASKIMLKTLFFYFMILTMTSLCLKTSINRDEKSEYLGCFRDSSDNRLFAYSPSDYIPNEISPISCMVACGDTHHYAGIANASICLCSMTKPKAFINNDFCDSLCPGTSGWNETEEQPSCGGFDALSVYDITNRIFALKINNTKDSMVYKNVVLETSLNNGDNLLFDFNAGDQHPDLGMFSTDSIQEHIYDVPGHYEVKVTAKNNISGPYTATGTINIFDEVSDVDIVCSNKVVYGNDVECYGTVTRGSPTVLNMDFGDGKSESVSPLVHYKSVGIDIPDSGSEKKDGINNATIVLPYAEFDSDQSVYAWEYHAAAVGEILLQVFEPTCKATKKYCLNSHLCADRDTPCTDLNEYQCKDDEVFCLQSQRCLPIDNNKKCSLYTPYLFNSVPAYYKLVDQISHTITKTGHNIFQVPTPMKVKKGCIIGWTSNGGAISYKEITNVASKTIEINFPLEKELNNLLYNKGELKSTHHFLAAHYIESGHFYIRHNYSSPGKYILKSNVTKDEIIHVDVAIKSISIQCPKIIKTYQQFEINTSVPIGTNVSYQVSFGNGTDQNQQVKPFIYTYDVAGVYIFKIKAFNSISSKEANCTVRVMQTIEGFKLKYEIKPVAVGESTIVEWCAEEGTNVTYIISYGDGNTDTKIDLDHGGCYIKNHIYENNGMYNVTITASNALGITHTISSKAVVDIPVGTVTALTTNEKLTNNLYANVDEPVNVNVTVSAGTNVFCKYFFENEARPTYTTDAKSMSHGYSVEGIYFISVECYNSISSSKTNIDTRIVVEALLPIQGLKISAKDTTFGISAEIQALMYKGSLYVCTWDFGDGKGLKVDASTFKDKVEHDYRKVGDYVIVLECTNALGSRRAQKTVAVEIPINGLGVLCPTSQFVQVNIPFDIYIDTKNGSRLTFNVEFGDGQYHQFDNSNGLNTSMEVKHSYSNPGVYLVNVTAWNRIDRMSSTCMKPLVAQYPVPDIQLITNAPVPLDESNVIFKVLFPKDKPLPTNATVEFEFGDGSEKRVLDLDILTGETEFITNHAYNKEGEYKADIVIQNKISNRKLTANIEIVKLAEVVVGALAYDPNTDSKTAGVGPNHVIFSLDESVSFTVSSQKYDRYYKIDYDENGNGNNSTESNFVYQYETTGNKTVTALVSNMLRNFTAQTIIQIQRKIEDVKIHYPSELRVNEASLINITMGSLGTHLCMVFDFGDGNALIVNLHNCYNITMDSSLKYAYLEIDDDEPIGISHTFNERGFTNISVNIYNWVSSWAETRRFFVYYKPCPLPVVRISGGGSENHPLDSPLSSKIVLQSNVTAECHVATNVSFHWKLYKEGKLLSTDDLKGYRVTAMPFKRNPGGLDPTVLTIPGNYLSYGRIEIALEVNYLEGSQGVMVDLITYDKAYLNIVPSPIRARILGGNSRGVPKYELVTFDGSESRDPDEIHVTGELTYAFYCRREDEEFPENYALSASNLADAGCFRNGRFLLNSRNEFFTQVNQEGSIIKINTTFKIYEKFVMRIHVRKGDRVGIYDQQFTILPGDPPALELYCSFNCYEKKFCDQEIRIQSVCTNCRDKRMYDVEYKWKMFWLAMTTTSSGKFVRNETEITYLDTLISTELTAPNIVFRKDSLPPGHKYVLKLAAWEKGAKPDHQGFSSFDLETNTPPSGGYCELDKKEGYAITTKFRVNCGNWEDEDLPLSYKVDVHIDGKVQNIYTGDEREITFPLRLGPKDQDYKYKMVVNVLDSMSYGTPTEFEVRVTSPESFDVDGFINELDSMADGDNEQALRNQALAFATVLNDKSESKQENKSNSIEARRKLLQTLSKQEACEMRQIKQMGAVQSEATKEPDDLDTDAQDLASNQMGSMADCILLVDERDPDMMEATDTLLSGAGNILSATRGSESKNGTNVTEMAGKSKTDQQLDTMNKIGGALLRQLVSGDKPKKTSTGGLDIEMSQVPENADEEETGFKLPDIQAMFGNQSHEIKDTGRQASVGTMLTSSKDNPYQGSTGSDDIKSDVMGVAVTDPSGNPMDLSGQEITMFVKRDTKSDSEPPVYEYDVLAGAMKVHRFNFTKDENFIAIEIRPIDEDVVTKVYISYEKRTTISNSVANYTQITLKEAKTASKSPDPFIRVFSTSELNGTGEYYIGIKLSPSRNEIWDKFGYDATMNYTLRTWETVCKLWDDEEKTYVTKGCVVGPKTTFQKTQCKCLVGDELPSAPATTTTTTTTTTTRATTLKPTPPPRPRKVVRRATFAGGFFVAPNPIDFSKAFEGFTNLAENPVAFATVLSIFGVYLILLFWARREDRKDIERAGVTALKENSPSDRQFYEITIYTGFASGAATTANVFCQLSGDEDQTDIRELKDPNRKLFQKRAEDVFLASFPKDIGDLQYIRIWHDNTGKSPSWYLTRIMVHDLNEDRKYLFLNDNFIAVEEGDGSLERVLAVAGPEEIKSFNHLFFSTTQRNLSDGHIWFSIFIRPPKSRFTRVQRLSCCLTLLYCTMVTNAMFYQVGGEADPSTTLHLGPFAFSPSQIWIGLITSLIIFPVNILIVGVFRSIGPKPTAEEMAKKKAKRFWWLRELFFCCPEKQKNDFMDIIQDSEASGRASRATIVSETLTLDGDDIGLKMETAAQEKRREEKANKMKKKKKKLPYWTKYFAWGLLILTSFTSAFFVVLYGFEFGKEKSAQWMSALFISFCQDVLISQPTKILGLALFIALIVKKPADDEDEEEEANKKQIDEDYIDHQDNSGESSQSQKMAKKDIIKFQPPSKEKIAALRTYRLKEIKMYNLIREILLYCLFVVALCQVTYSFMDPRAYFFRKSLEDTFVSASYGGDKKFDEITSVNEVWPWLETTVMTGLYATHWYNGDPNNPGFTQDLSSYLFGGSRLRQLRIRDQSCIVHERFTDMIPNCHAWYSWGDEDTDQYDPGWKPLTNHTNNYDPNDYLDAWYYRSSEDLDTYPFVGALAAYGGGGYVGNMGKSPKESKSLLESLKKNLWLDDQTRAVFLEVTVYNGQVNLFAIMNFVIEILPTNGAVVFHSIKVARLYTFGGSVESFTIACQFFVLIFFMIFMYREGKKMYRERKAYFRGFWNLLEFTIIVLVFATAGVFFSRKILVDKAVEKIESNPGAFVSFNKVVQWDTMFTALTSILVLLSCIKAIKLLQYNKTISLLASTLKGSAKPLAAFFVVFLVFFIAFTSFAYLMFIPYLSDYRSFLTASESVLSLLLGSFSYQEISETQRILGPIWFFLIMMFGVMYLMNVFLSIVMETYANVKDDLSKQNQEYELVDFMIKKFMHVIGKGDGGKKEVLAKVTEAEEKRAREEAAKLKKANRKLAMKAKNTKSYKKLDDEIETKFSQLDNSLDGYWNKYFTDDHPGVNTGYTNVAFDYQEFREEVEIENDMKAELAKWQ